MLFNSWNFIFLVLATFCLYYIPLLRRYQIYILLLASTIFYAIDSRWMLLLLFLSALLNACSSYAAVFGKRPKLYATLGICLNLLLLAIFKYSGLVGTSFFDTNNGIGHFLVSIPLPLGISFYTFSGISLVVDAYRGRLDTTTETHISANFLQHVKNTFLYIFFFPKILSGPIAKSRDFFADITPKYIKDINWAFVFKALVVGYFLKMVIADNLKDFTFWMTFPHFQYRGTGSLIVMLFGYSMQMFSDFAGYSLIAIGVAAIFGYHLPTNFLFPYISASFREFWKRWHITLSNFLMEYLYISLGGNRKGKMRTYINLILTMMLGGLWHGAAWSYLVWGTYHGLCLAIERAVCGRRDSCIMIGKVSSDNMKKVSRWISITFVFTMVSIGWLFFALPDFSQALLYIKCIFSNYGTFAFVDPKLLPIIIYSIPVVVYHILYLNRQNKWFGRYVFKYDYVWYGIMLFIILTNSGSANSFIYFQF